MEYVLLYKYSGMGEGLANVFFILCGRDGVVGKVVFIVLVGGGDLDLRGGGVRVLVTMSFGVEL